MRIADLESLRDSNGYINLNGMDERRTQPNVLGRKPKNWFLLTDGRILFKETNPLSYEDLSQLFFAEFAGQCGLEHADYDLAILDGKKGVITPDFTKEGELLISGETLLTLLKDTYEQNNIGQPVCNSVESFKEALNLINVDEKIINSSIDTLIRRLIFDSTLLETDRNSTNHGFITSPKTFLFVKDYKKDHLIPLNSIEVSLRLAPLYDGTNIFGLNRNAMDIQTKIRNIKDVSTIYSIIANSKRSFFFSNETQDQPFVQELQTISQRFPEIIKEFIPKILDLSLDEALSNIENKIKKEVPFEMVIWMDKILKYNKENILYICQPFLNEKKDTITR